MPSPHSLPRSKGLCCQGRKAGVKEGRGREDEPHTGGNLPCSPVPGRLLLMSQTNAGGVQDIQSYGNSHLGEVLKINSVYLLCPSLLHWPVQHAYDPDNQLFPAPRKLQGALRLQIYIKKISVFFQTTWCCLMSWKCFNPAGIAPPSLQKWLPLFLGVFQGLPYLSAPRPPVPKKGDRPAWLKRPVTHEQPQRVTRSYKCGICHSQSNPQAEICFYETLVILDNNKSVQIPYSHKLPSLNRWPTYV